MSDDLHVIAKVLNDYRVGTERIEVFFFGNARDVSSALKRLKGCVSLNTEKKQLNVRTVMGDKQWQYHTQLSQPGDRLFFIKVCLRVWTWGGRKKVTP